MSVDVFAGETTRVQVDLVDVTGIVTGSVLVNGAPSTSPLVMCMDPGLGAKPDGTRYYAWVWCAEIPADGTVTYLLPEGDIFFAGCRPEDATSVRCRAAPGNNTHALHEFTFYVTPGSTSRPLQIGTDG